MEPIWALINALIQTIVGFEASAIFKIVIIGIIIIKEHELINWY